MMIPKLIDMKNEDLSREELIQKLAIIEGMLRSKDRTIQGQNVAIQTLTANNLMMLDLLEQVKAYEPNLFNRSKFERLKERIIEKLDEMRGRGRGR